MPIQSISRDLEERLELWLEEIYSRPENPEIKRTPRYRLDNTVIPALALVCVVLAILEADLQIVMGALLGLGLGIAFTIHRTRRRSSEFTRVRANQNAAAHKAALGALASLNWPLSGETRAALTYLLNLIDARECSGELEAAIAAAREVPGLEDWQPLIAAQKRLKRGLPT